MKSTVLRAVLAAGWIAWASAGGCATDERSLGFGDPASGIDGGGGTKNDAAAGSGGTAGAPSGDGACRCDPNEVPAIGCSTGVPTYVCERDASASCHWHPTCPIGGVGGQPGDPATVVWGGADAELSQTSTDATLQLDCASGSLSSALPSSGSAEIPGTYAQGRGGPVDPGVPTSLESVTYRVMVSGTRMELTIIFDDRSDAGPFTLVRGVRGDLTRCL